MPPSDSPTTILVNDRPRPWPGAAPLRQLLDELGLTERRGVAVAVNDEVVPRSRWTEHVVAAGARVLVIQATQGG